MVGISKWLVLAAIVLGVAVACQAQVRQRATPTPPANGVLTAGIMPSAKAFLTRATEAAKKWHSDAYLHRLQIIIIDQRVQDKSGDITMTFLSGLDFEFHSNADTQHDYRVSFFRNGDVSELQGQAELIDLPSIKPSDWPLDNVDAWQIALANGGSQFLEQAYQQTRYGDTDCFTRLVRFASVQDKLVWDVGCQTSTIAQDLFRFWIDPQSGEIVERFP